MFCGRYRHSIACLHHLSRISTSSKTLHSTRMAAVAVARSAFRSTSVRSAAARLTSGAKTSPSTPFRIPSRSPLSSRIFRCPAEMSACVESLQPHHTATASALMTSMLTASRCGFAWLPEALDDA